MKDMDQKELDEIDLQEIFEVIWTAKIKIFVITAIFAIFSIFYALSIPNQYKATSILIPTKQEGGGVSSALGQFGGLASLAGVSIGADNTSEAKVAEEIMKSWGFIESFIEDNNLAVEIIAANGWDRRTNTLSIDEDVYDIISSKWVDKEPTSWNLFQSYQDKLTISSDKSSGLLSVSMEYYSPEIAKKWLDLYIEAINKHMQKRQIEKVNRNIQYLEEQIGKTSIGEMREVFYEIIGEQIKSKMLAEASPEYVFVAISPSMKPEEKSQPKRSTICITITLAGTFLSLLYVLGMHYFRKYSEKSNNKDF